MLGLEVLLGCDVSWWGVCLAYAKPWNPPAPCYLWVLANACNPSTGEVEAGGSEVGCHSQLHSEF